MAQAIALPEVSDVIRVLTVNRDQLNGQLLAAAFEQDKRFQMLDTVPDVQAITAVIASEKPAVILVSAEIEGNERKGIELARELNRRRRGAQVVMLLESSTRDSVVDAFRAGAHGVFLRSEPLTSLAKCIVCVNQGQVWASSKELQYLLEALNDALPLRVMDARCANMLTRRERDVVGCVVDGLSNREIAQRLGLAEHTIKNNLFRIFGKLGVSKRVEVVVYAYGLGMLPSALPSVRTESPTVSAHQG